MLAYDSKIIRQFATTLYEKANTIVFIYTVLGALIGMAMGAVKGVVAAVIGLIVGGALGFYLGIQKAFDLKLRAQTALCQVQIEENTRFPKSSAQSDSTSLLRPATTASLEGKASSSPATAPIAENQMHAMKPMGSCPNCDALIPLDSEICLKCKANFGSGATWQIRPIA